MLGTVGLLLHPKPGAQLNQSHLGWVAHSGGTVGVAQGGVAVQQGNLQQGPLGVVGQLQVGAPGQDAVGPDVLDRHPVLGQGSGFVRANHLHRSQALDGFELFDNRVLPGHFLGAHGQNDGDNGAESLRDSCHRQSHGEHQGIQDGHAAAVDRQQEHPGADDQNQESQLAREVIQVLLQRGLALLGLVHQAGDPAQLGLHAGGGDHHDGPAIGDQRAGKDHVFLVAQGNFFPGDGGADLFHRLTLAGEGTLVDLEGPAVQKPAVGHDQIAGFQLDDVPRHHLAAGDFLPLAVPQHLGGGGAHGLEALKGFFGFEILDGAQHRVQDQNRKDHQGALKIAREHGDQGGRNQDDHQKILELPGKNCQGTLFLALGQLVGPHLGQPLGGLGAGQPA